MKTGRYHSKTDGREVHQKQNYGLKIYSEVYCIDCGKIWPQKGRPWIDNAKLESLGFAKIATEPGVYDGCMIASYVGGLKRY
jgi:hypothetical protein